MEPDQYAAAQPTSHLPPNKPGRKLLLITSGLGFALVLALVAFVWAFRGYQDNKNNVDAKVAVAVSEAEKSKAEELAKDFEAERNRLFNSYTTDPVLGNVTLQYPRDWSFYLEQKTTSGTQINAIFHPTVVAKANPATYGLRLQLVEKLYADVVDDYQTAIERGELLANPLTNGNTNGLRLDGQIDRDHNGAVVIFPIRDKTLLIFTDSKEYLSVFNKAIDKLTFTP